MDVYRRRVRNIIFMTQYFKIIVTSKKLKMHETRDGQIGGIKDMTGENRIFRAFKNTAPKRGGF